MAGWFSFSVYACSLTGLRSVCLTAGAVELIGLHFWYAWIGR